MTVSVNGASGVAVGDGYNTTLTASLTVAAGSQRLLVAFTNGACTGVTYGGTAMTMSDSRSGIASALDTKCWTLADPTVGTANLVATRASNGPMMLTGRCVNGYNSGAGFSFAHYTLTFRNSPQSLAASIPAGGMGLSYIVDSAQSTLGYTAGAGSTKDAEFTAGGYYAYAVESIPGAASAAEWSWASGQRDIAHHVIVISGDVVAPTITADQGSYTVSGQTASLFFNRLVLSEQGAYTLTGQDATLTHGTPGAYSITCDSGTYTIAGTDAYIDLSMNAEYGVYGVVGQDVTLTQSNVQSYSITAEQGTYSLSGQGARLTWSNEVVTTNGIYTIAMSMRIGL